MAEESQAKKFCLEKTKQGKKIPELARYFESYGVPLRVRCKLCYQDWFQKGVDSLVEEGVFDWENMPLLGMKLHSLAGVSKNEATERMQLRSPADSDVPNYAKSGTESLKRHLVVKHK